MGTTLRYQVSADSLTVGEVADGGAVLATGGIVDLPCVPPGQRGDLLVHGAACAHLLTRRALLTRGIINIKS